MKIPSSLNATLVGALIVGAACSLPNASAETLADVKSSQAMEEVRRDTEKARAKLSQRQGGVLQNPFSAGMDPHANFTQLWETSRGPEQLLSWIGINIPGFNVRLMDTTRSFKDVFAYVRLTDSSGRQVNVQIRVPHPNYYLMVEHKSMPTFTQYEPPKLKTVAEEEMEFSGLRAMYYRSEHARCSIVIKVEKLGIVNLSVNRCENSNIMMQVANALDFKRLNSKLTS
jgi:hypothetical protein